MAIGTFIATRGTNPSQTAVAGGAPTGPSGPNAGALPPVGAVYVGKANCDDSRTPVEVTSASTPWCTLTRAAAGASTGTEVLIAPGRYAAITANGATTSAGLSFRAATAGRRPVIAGGTFKNARGYTFEGLQFSARLTLNRSRDMDVRGNVFAGATLYIKQSQRVRVQGNRLTHFRGAARAILLQSSYVAKVATNIDVSITHNVISDIDHDAIAVYNGYRRLTISGNRISNVHQPPGFPFHSDAIQLMGGDGLKLTGNVISSVTHGILLKDGRPSTRTIVRSNLVVAVGGAALQLYNSPGALVQDNTFWNARYGVVLGNAGSVADSTRVTLVANVLVDLRTTQHGLIAGARGNVFGRGRRVGRPAYRGTPHFVDPGRGNYVISTTRPGAGLRPGAPLPGPQLKVQR